MTEFYSSPTVHDFSVTEQFSNIVSGPIWSHRLNGIDPVTTRFVAYASRVANSQIGLVLHKLHT